MDMCVIFFILLQFTQSQTSGLKCNMLVLMANTITKLNTNIDEFAATADSN